MNCPKRNCMPYILHIIANNGGCKGSFSFSSFFSVLFELLSRLAPTFSLFIICGFELVSVCNTGLAHRASSTRFFSAAAAACSCRHLRMTASQRGQNSSRLYTVVSVFRRSHRSDVFSAVRKPRITSLIEHGEMSQ